MEHERPRCPDEDSGLLDVVVTVHAARQSLPPARPAPLPALPPGRRSGGPTEARVASRGSRQSSTPGARHHGGRKGGDEQDGQAGGRPGATRGMRRPSAPAISATPVTVTSAPDLERRAAPYGRDRVAGHPNAPRRSRGHERQSARRHVSQLSSQDSGNGPTREERRLTRGERSKGPCC